MRARGFLPILPPASLLPISTAAAPSTDAGRIAGVMHVRHGLQLG